MKVNPKGHALISNINNKIEKDNKIGLAVDTANLYKLFIVLGFIVHPKEACLTGKVLDIYNLLRGNH
jgi:hypothetical protein